MISPIDSIRSFGSAHSAPTRPANSQSEFTLELPARPAERHRDSTVDTRPGMSDSASDRENRELLARLTPEDWATVSAAVGYACGPDETGYIHPLQPMLAWSIALDRDFGKLKGPVTADYLKSIGGTGGPAGFASQVANALDFVSTDEVDQRLRAIDLFA